MKIVFLVSGKRCSGKDTFCNILQYKLQQKEISVEKFAAADECKRMFAERNNLDYERLRVDREYKEQHRAGLTEFFWTNDLIIFEDLVADSINKSTASVCIVTDFRFFSQLERITAFANSIAVITIRIDCNDENRTRRGWNFDEHKDRDVTETALDDFEFFHAKMDNNGTLSDLEKQVDKLINDFNL